MTKDIKKEDKNALSCSSNGNDILFPLLFVVITVILMAVISKMVGA